MTMTLMTKLMDDLGPSCRRSCLRVNRSAAARYNSESKLNDSRRGVAGRRCEISTEIGHVT